LDSFILFPGSMLDREDGRSCRPNAAAQDPDTQHRADICHKEIL
jgi:hypothetical protein